MKKDKQKNVAPEVKPAGEPEVKAVKQPEPGEGGEGTWVSALGGRKFILVFLTMVGVVIVGCVRGDLKTEEITDTLMWLAAIGAGSIALEDGLGRISSRKG